MGRKPEELWYEEVDFKDIKVMVIEWTHGNSYYLKGVDIPVLLSSTPQETLEFRKNATGTPEQTVRLPKWY